MEHKTKRKALLADALLLSVAVFWGANFVFIKSGVEHARDTVDPVGKSLLAGTMLYLVLRYVVATAIFAAAQPRSWLRACRREWAMGGLLGFFYLTALILQTVGLQRTSPGVSGFITGLSVAMVPFLYWAVAKRSPGKWQVVGALVATAGLTALSLQGDFTIKWGDAITLAGTLFYALHIMTTGFFAPKVNPSTLAVTQMATSMAMCLVIAPFFVDITFDLPWQVWAAVIWTALSGTIYAFFIQSWAQQYTTSTHAAILLGFESVFAAIAGLIFGMDTLTWRLMVGGSLMITGVLIIELLPAKGSGLEHEAAPGALLPVDSGAASDEEGEAGQRIARGRSYGAEWLWFPVWLQLQPIGATPAPHVHARLLVHAHGAGRVLRVDTEEDVVVAALVQAAEDLDEQGQPESPAAPRPAHHEVVDVAGVAAWHGHTLAGDLVDVPRHHPEPGVEIRVAEDPSARHLERLRMEEEVLRECLLVGLPEDAVVDAEPRLPDRHAGRPRRRIEAVARSRCAS